MAGSLRMTPEQVEAHQKRVGKLVAGPALQAQTAILKAKQEPASFSKNKYRAQRIQADEHTFDSKKEFRNYMALKLREKAGEIEGLRVHVRFSLFDPGENCKGEHIGTYTADVVFKESGKLVVGDTKSRYTRNLRGWSRTKSLMRACHGIDVVEML